MTVEDAEVVVGDHALADLVAGVNVHRQFGVLFVEAQQAREQPVLRHSVRADNADIAAAMAALEPQHISQQALQHRLDDGIEGSTGLGQGNTACAPLEQRRRQVILQHLDLLADCALRQA